MTPKELRDAVYRSNDPTAREAGLKAADEWEKLIDLSDKFFTETMKNFNVGQSCLSAEDFSTWNELAILVRSQL